MDTLKGLLRASAASIAAAVLLLAWPAQAKADVIDDIAWVLNELEKANANPLPIKGSDLKESKGLFTCLDKASNDVQVVQCVDNFKDTSLGKKAAGQAGIPSWFWDLLDVYIAFREKDYWGVVAKLGEATICIVAQVLVGGADLCGLIEELIKIGKGLLDAGKAVAQFVASVGEAAWEGIKSVGCSLGLGGCGGGSKTPPEIIAYNCVFAPRVKPDGLNAMKAADAFAMPKLRYNLEKSAVAGIPCPMYGNLKIPVSQAAASKAGSIFTSAVEGVWTGDILQNVLAARDKKRQEYATAQQIASLASAASAEYGAKKTDPKNFVVSRCAVDDFGAKFGFAHVDRWLVWRTLGSSKTQLDAQKATNVTSNKYWCLVDVFIKHTDQFAKHFRGYVQSHYCAAFGQQLACTTLAKHQACIGLMKSVGQEGQCGANTVSLGKEIAAKIHAHFKSKQSKYACQTVLPDGGAPMSSKPVEFACTRPTQLHFCKQQYQQLWKGPPEVLACTLPKLDPEYAARIAKVKSAVTVLQGKYPGVGVDAVDPLLVHAGASSSFGAIKKASDEAAAWAKSADAVKFTFLLSASLTIDGVSRPTMVADVEKPDLLGNIPMSVDAHIAPVKPGDPDPFAKPAAGLTSPSMMANPAAIGVGAPSGIGGAPIKPLSGSAPFPTGGRESPFAQQAPPIGDAAPGLPQGTSLPGLQAPPLPALQAPRAPGVATPQLPAVQSPRATGVATPRLPAVQSPLAPGVAAPQLPAVQSPRTPGVAAPQLPAVQSPRATGVATPQLPAVQSPRAPGVATPQVPESRSSVAPATRLPPAQAPQAPARAPSGAAAPPAPDWGAVGRTGSALTPPAAPPPVALPPAAPARIAPAVPAAATPGFVAIQRELAAVSCQPSGAPLRFACTTRAGFDRCETMRKQNRVEQCGLNERR